MTSTGHVSDIHIGVCILRHYTMYLIYKVRVQFVMYEYCTTYRLLNAGVYLWKLSVVIELYTNFHLNAFVTANAPVKSMTHCTK